MVVSNKLFLDANILLELLLPNRRKTKQCELYLQGANKEIFISVLSVHIVYYYCLKVGYSMEQIDSFISNYKIAPATDVEYRTALQIIIDNDFEDALQVSVAMSAGCDSFATIDKQLAKNYEHLIDIHVI